MDLLCIRFLQQSRPELAFIGGVHEGKLILTVDGETIVDDNIHPLTEAPEAKPEHSAVGIATLFVYSTTTRRGDERLTDGNHLREDTTYSNYFILNKFVHIHVVL